MSQSWQRVVVVVVVIATSWCIAQIVDWRISRRGLPPEAITRYRVLRRSIFSAIVFVGILSALLVIPQVRAIAGGVLASSAVIGLVIGFASQRTIGNFVAGLLIALAQPVRLGDDVEVAGTRGVVEEIGLTYTWLRTRGGDRLVVPNEKLAAETIRNSTIRRDAAVVSAKIQVPFAADLRRAVAALEAAGGQVAVTGLGDRASLVIRREVPAGVDVEQAATELYLQAAERLKAEGIAPA